MAKKRPTLDAFLNSHTGAKDESSKISQEPTKESGATSVKKEVEQISQKIPLSDPKVSKHEIIRHMLYLPLPVYDQLQSLIFEEQRGQTKRRKTHDYLMDAIDLLFKEKGLKSITELTKKP